MRTGRIIRCLFGRSDYLVRDGILADLDAAIRSPHKLGEQWYCYGLNNADELEKRGIHDFVLMDQEPLSRFDSSGERNPQHHGTINYGSNIFRHRYPCIKSALEWNEAVVMLDLDTVAVKPVPVDLWERLGRGAEFQCALRLGKKPYATWRTRDHGYVPCGSLTYWRGQRAIAKMMELYAKNPEWWDPVVLARMADSMITWCGPQWWNFFGQEPRVHVFSEGRQVHRAEEMIFRSGRKKGLRSILKTKNLISSIK